MLWFWWKILLLLFLEYFLSHWKLAESKLWCLRHFFKELIKLKHFWKFQIFLPPMIVSNEHAVHGNCETDSSPIPWTFLTPHCWMPGTPVSGRRGWSRARASLSTIMEMSSLAPMLLATGMEVASWSRRMARWGQRSTRRENLSSSPSPRRKPPETEKLKLKKKN